MRAGLGGTGGFGISEGVTFRTKLLLGVPLL
jgi:hypothetical protein